MSPPAIRPASQASAVSGRSVAVATVPEAGAVTQAIPDVKMIDDHLAVQAIIRAYQVIVCTCITHLSSQVTW